MAWGSLGWFGVVWDSRVDRGSRFIFSRRVLVTSGARDCRAVNQQTMCAKDRNVKIVFGNEMFPA